VENLGIFWDSSSKLVQKVMVDHSSIFQLPSPPPLPRCDFSPYKVRSQLRHHMPCCNVIFHWETMTVNDLRRIMFALGGKHSGPSFYSMNVLFYISNTANISYSRIRCDVHKYFAGHICLLKNPNHEHPHHHTLFGLESHKHLPNSSVFASLQKTYKYSMYLFNLAAGSVSLVLLLHTCIVSADVILYNW
jgi:hypothetical protein